MKHLVVTGIFCLLSVILFGDNQIIASKSKEKSNWTSDNIHQQADSLLKAGNEKEALELYFKAANISESFSSLQYPFFRAIGDIYLKNGEYQKAIHFYREYEWMAMQQIEFTKGHRPRIGVEWWAQTDADRLALEGSLKEFSVQLRALEEKQLK